VETPHFLFIFEPRDRASVDELVTFAEDVYAKVTGFFRSYPAKVPCVIRGRIDEANGVTMSFPSRIDLYLTAPTDFFLGARSESWLKLLLTHELTHFVHQSMDTGLLHGLSLVFGTELSAASLSFLPGWAVEGPAVYDETVFSEGGRGRNPLFEIYTKAAAEEGTLFSLDQAAYLSPTTPPSRIYVAGYALVDWLQRTYGPDTLRQIMVKYLDFPFLGPWSAIARVTGEDASVIFANMRESMIARYAPFTSIPGGTLVTPNRVGDWSHPQPTARGLYLYRTRPGAFPAIVRWDAAARTEHVLVNVRLTDAASFSATADGRTVWFSTERTDASRPAELRTTADLFRLDTDTGSVRQVTRDEHLWHPQADGARVLAVQGSGPYTRLVSVDPEDGSVLVLFSRALANVYTPAISPDGQAVAFIVNVRGFQDLYVASLPDLHVHAVALPDAGAPVIDVNADRARPLTGPDPQGEYFPSFRDDATVLFSSDRTGEMALYQVDLASGAVSLVQRDPVAVTGGVISGDSLLYASYAANGACIKSVALGELFLQPVDISGTVLPYPGPAPTAAGSPAASTTPRPWLDLPLPYLWYPRLLLAQNGPLLSDLSAGLGAAALGGSLLGATTWTADAGWLFGADQPDAGVTFSSSIGPVSISVDSRLSYGWTGAWTQSIQSALDLAWSVFDESHRDVSRSLLLGTGFQQDSQIQLLGAFTLRDSLAAPASAWSGYLGVPARVDYRWRIDRGRVDFTPPWALRAVLSGIAWLPVMSLDAAQGEADVLLSVNVPSFLPHQVIQLGLKATQDFVPAAAGPGTFQDSFTLARGFAGVRTRAASGGLLASLDYHVPLGFADAPLILGWGVTGGGIGMHVEGIADVDAPSGFFGVLPVVYAGADLTARLSFASFTLPVGIGLAARISTMNPGSFDPSTDLGLYAFIGFDSLGGTFERPSAAQRPSVAQRSGTVQSMLTPMSPASFSMSASE
jgi:hypothetical protein